jgi:hypothetical protein
MGCLAAALLAAAVVLAPAAAAGARDEPLRAARASAPYGLEAATGAVPLVVLVTGAIQGGLPDRLSWGPRRLGEGQGADPATKYSYLVQGTSGPIARDAAAGGQVGVAAVTSYALLPAERPRKLVRPVPAAVLVLSALGGVGLLVWRQR